jgi:C4-dicarboxylate-specific signal transduction histidine kinase
MYLLELSIENRVMIGIAAMVLLFASFLIAFISSQRRKLQYHKSLHALHEEQQRFLREQNVQLEQNVQERTQELSMQKEELQKSFAELKSTQLQLVQREKMASLGELTAGIAHEIQNPLNFVNNFSEISKELAEEMEKELEAGNQQAAKLLSRELIENLDKIAFHGKRAEAIVKGMLQHSRGSLGVKEPTDLNYLVDEYLRLTFHAVRAKNKNFSVALHTEFDPNVGKVNIYAQDIMRVLVNLYTNAFYSMQQRQKRQAEGYEPVLTVCTKRNRNNVEIRVKDNGTGIPYKIVDKIYQPFFTTKPAGEGTGLGLSLSYDIVTKGHGGELIVETREGEGAAFTVQLPTR